MTNPLPQLFATTWPLFGSLWSIVGTVLLWILLVLGILLLLFVLIPIQFRAHGRLEGNSFDGRAVIRWAWGVIGIRLSTEDGATLRLFGLRILRLKGGNEDAEKKEKKKKPKRKGASILAQLRWTLRHRRTTRRILGQLLRSLRLRTALRGEVGLDDPADTALLLQVIALVQGRLNGKHVVLDLEPDFVDEALSLEGRASAHLWFLHLSLVLLINLLRRDTWQMLRARPR